MRLSVEFEGHSLPTEEGNYLVVNAMTTEQFAVRVHRHLGEDRLRVFSTQDCMCHETSDYLDPEFRWFLIKPLSKKQCVDLAQPATA